ncbi:ComEA family DNA-binding protein [Thiovibrio sp. JS02]
MSRKNSIEQAGEDRRPLVLLILAALILILAAARSSGLLNSRRPDPPAVIVWLEGDLRAGLYQFPAGATLADLYRRTGCKAPEQAELARPLPNQAAIRLTAETPPRFLARMPNAAAPLFFQPLAVNSATAEQLATIPGLGPKLTARIVALREKRGGRLASLEDLLEVKGIGEKKLAVLKKNLVLH